MQTTATSFYMFSILTGITAHKQQLLSLKSTADIFCRQYFTHPEAKHLYGSDKVCKQELVGRPSENDSIKSQISSKTSRGKKDSTTKCHQRHHQQQPNEHVFPIQVYFYLFLYLYKTRITINNGSSHLKSPKNRNRRAALGRPAIKFLGVGEGALTSSRSTNPRPWLGFGSPNETTTNNKNKTKRTQTKSKAKH